jgi:type IV pilus assembly protein PilO
MSQLLDRLGKLPRSQRLLVYGLTYLVMVVAVFFLLIAPVFDDIDGARTRQATLKTKRDEAKARADNKGEFEAEVEQLTADLKQALKELPDDREIPGLLSEIDALARKSGLEVRKFQPLAETTHEYYADVPVQIIMSGSFHEVAIFFDRVGKMSRIVSVEDIEMKDPKDSGTETTLTVEGKVVTYRFLTEDEIKKRDDEKGKKKKKKGEEE